MQLTKKRAEIIAKWLVSSDYPYVAGVLGTTRGYVFEIMTQRINPISALRDEVVMVCLRRAQENKRFAQKYGRRKPYETAIEAGERLD
jgi:hypothetical protein